MIEPQPPAASVLYVFAQESPVNDHLVLLVSWGRHGGTSATSVGEKVRVMADVLHWAGGQEKEASRTPLCLQQHHNDPNLVVEIFPNTDEEHRQGHHELEDLSSP